MERVSLNEYAAAPARPLLVIFLEITIINAYCFE